MEVTMAQEDIGFESIAIMLNSEMMIMRDIGAASTEVGRIAGKGVLKLMQLMYKLANSSLKIITKNDYLTFKGFVKDSEGSFSLLSVPEYDSEILKDFQDRCRKSGIKFYCMPHLGGDIHHTTYAVANSDRNRFQDLYQDLLFNNIPYDATLSLNQLRTITGGQYTIYNVPFPDHDREKLNQLIEILNSSQVRYSILPDTQIGDGYIQIAISDMDSDAFSKALELYQNKYLQNPTPLYPEAKSEDDYFQMANMNEDDYLNNASQEVKNIVYSQQKMNNPIIENFNYALNPEESGRNIERNMTAAEYASRKKQPDIIELTANEVLFAGDTSTTYHFRIPYTQNIFDVNKNDVYLADNGKTYCILLNKNQKYGQFDANYIKLGFDAVTRKMENHIRENQPHPVGPANKTTKNVKKPGGLKL